jgi:hypothetical protein
VAIVSTSNRRKLQGKHVQAKPYQIQGLQSGGKHCAVDAADLIVALHARGCRSEASLQRCDDIRASERPCITREIKRSKKWPALTKRTSLSDAGNKTPSSDVMLFTFCSTSVTHKMSDANTLCFITENKNLTRNSHPMRGGKTTPFRSAMKFAI